VVDAAAGVLSASGIKIAKKKSTHPELYAKRSTRRARIGSGTVVREFAGR
jgi:hypothetical protein